MNAPHTLPREPELPLGDIQGIVVPGFLKPHQTLLCVRFGDAAAAMPMVKALLRELQITDAKAALADRQEFRDHPGRGGLARAPLTALAFTYPGLCALMPRIAPLQPSAFTLGLPARSALLGDPVDPKEPGHPSSWKVGGPDSIPDFMVVIAGDKRAQVDDVALDIVNRMAEAGLEVTRHDGDKRRGLAKGREHFGFADGISQPGIRGRASDDERDFITKRWIAPEQWPDSALYGYPGQELVWPGEFVLGYARSSPDPLRPGPIAEPERPWMKNGSFLVYNRLLQDVGLFWRTMREQANALSGLPGFEEMFDEALAARLVGRRQDGAPVSRLRSTEGAFVDGLGSNPLANNQFRFESDTPRQALTAGSDAYPRAHADPLGLVCPLASHVRKVNPRDAASDMGGDGAAYQRRILRVGIPFGPDLADRYAEKTPGEPERGLLFLSVQASIEDQFEFLQARWMNDDRRPKSPGGNDMIAGRWPTAGDSTRRCVLFGSGAQAATVEAKQPFVVSSGGAYFFVPSLTALEEILGDQ